MRCFVLNKALKPTFLKILSIFVLGNWYHFSLFWLLDHFIEARKRVCIVKERDPFVHLKLSFTIVGEKFLGQSLPSSLCAILRENWYWFIAIDKWYCPNSCKYIFCLIFPIFNPHSHRNSYSYRFSRKSILAFDKCTGRNISFIDAADSITAQTVKLFCCC